MADIIAERQRRGRSDVTLALLAIAAASSDVLSFLILREVFTSGMTGNTALLGLSLGQDRVLAASRAAVALLGFVLGVVAGTLAQGGPERPRPLALLLALEALCLGLFAALWHAGWPEGDGFAYPLIFLSALGMGLQIVAARQINLPGLPTVVFTTTLASILITATTAARRRQALPIDAWRQVAIFFSYLAAAVLAGALALRAPGLLVLLPLAAVLAALALQWRSRPRAGA
jgi:uncharacterized membrane protein YoaK (UPF0700 family)